jgi:hypothetical protein
MSTDTSSLRAFIEARIAEDESDADGYHRYEGGGSVLTCDHVTAAGYDHCTCEHPARLLREVAAKRAILSLLDQVEGMEIQINGEWGSSLEPVDREVSEGLLRALAQPFADHPDYRTEWSTA